MVVKVSGNLVVTIEMIPLEKLRDGNTEEDD